VPPGTIYYVYGSDIWGMKADGSSKSLALPGYGDGYPVLPSSLVYGADRHRLWLGVDTVPGQFYPLYDDPSLNTGEQSELFAYRRNPAGGVQKIQITDLFPWIMVSNDPGRVQWSNDGADSFVSFKAVDLRAYYLTGNEADLRWAIFRIRVRGADIDAAAGAGLLLGVDALEEVVSTYPGWYGDDLKHSWSPDGNQVATTLRSGATGDIGDIYAKNLTTGQVRLLYDTPINYHPPEFRWSPDGGRLVLSTGSIWTINANTGALLQTVLQSGTTSYTRACWSPDGTQLAIREDRHKVSGTSYFVSRLPSTGGTLTSLSGDLNASSTKFPIGWVSDTAAAP